MDRRTLWLIVAAPLALVIGLGVTALATWPVLSSCSEIPIGHHPPECFSVGDIEVIPPIEPWRVVPDWRPWGFGPTVGLFVAATVLAYALLVAMASRRSTTVEPGTGGSIPSKSSVTRR